MKPGSYSFLRHNISASRIAGFIVSNFLGLAIVMIAILFYTDARSLWQEPDSFVQSDYLVINKRVAGMGTGKESSVFSADELADLQRQPWVRSLAPFVQADYRVQASISTANAGASSSSGNSLADGGISTMMFFESIPDSYVDVPPAQWQWREGDETVPIIISKDYLALYNFGFAGAAGMPQMSEGMMGGIPLRLSLTGEDGNRHIETRARIAGFSNRLNTILVPMTFMEWSNSLLGSRGKQANSGESGNSGDSEASRLIIDVSSPGDVAIKDYMESRDYEIAGDKSGSSAAFMLRLVVGIVVGIGAVITILSLALLLLSLSLLLEKNRQSIHLLLTLGYDLGAAARPYRGVVIWSSVAAFILATTASLLLRNVWIAPLQALGASSAGIWPSLAVGLALTLLTITLNLLSINRKVRSAWSL